MGRGRRSHRKTIALLPAAMVFGCIAVPAEASQQSATTSDGSQTEADREESGLTVEDIIVTARRREESLQTAPISVTALTADDLVDRGIRDISDIALVTPGFSMQNVQGGTEQPFIRGMSSTSFERNLQTSSSFVDGNYFSVLGRTTFLADVERVEVIRGPQAALFGRATFAGAINYVTKNPTPDLAGEVRLEAGEHGRLNAHGSMSGPLAGDKLQFRFSGTSEQFGGEYRNTLDGKKTGVLRRYGLTGALRFLPTDNITIDLKGFRTWFRDDGQTPQYIQGAATLNCFPNAAGVPTYFCGKLVTDASQIRLNLDQVEGGLQNTDQKRAILNVDWRLGDYLLTATTTYADQDSDTFCDCDYSGFRSLGGAFQSRFDSSIKNRSQEVRLRSPQSSSFRWMAGAYIFSEDSNTFRSNTTPIIIPFVDVTTKSVFGSVEVDLGEALTVTAEGRYQDERQKRSAIPGNPAIDVTYKAFLPRVIADFKLTDRILLYASAAKGNQPGQFNTGINIPADRVKVDSESLWSYEIGAKTKLFDDRLRLNVAGYRIDWSNQVFRTEVVGTDGRIVNILDNLGKSRINGFELEAAAALAPGLTANATFAYIDAKYEDFLSPNALRVYRVAQVAGRRLPNTPKYQASFSSAYTVPITEETDFFVRGDYSFRGRQFVSEVNQAFIGNLHLVNLSAGFDTDRLRVALAVDNVLNSEVPEFATRFTDLNSPGLSRFGYLLKLRNGRAARVSLQYKF